MPPLNIVLSIILAILVASRTDIIVPERREHGSREDHAKGRPELHGHFILQAYQPQNITRLLMIRLKAKGITISWRDLPRDEWPPGKPKKSIHIPRRTLRAINVKDVAYR
eukprot:5054659-Pleurochrysis_carterae.AAC.7